MPRQLSEHRASIAGVDSHAPATRICLIRGQATGLAGWRGVPGWPKLWRSLGSGCARGLHGGADMKRVTYLAALGLLAAVQAAGHTGCAAEDTEPSLDEIEVTDDGGKADGATETRVRAAGTTLWVRNEVRRERRADDREVFVVRGRTSRNLVDGYGFVFDDPKGDFASLSARTFEITYATDDAGLVQGQDHFVSLTMVPSRDRPDSLTGRLVVRPRLTEFSGYGAYLVSEVKPIVYGGRVVYRIRGTTSSTLEGLRVQAGDLFIDDARILDDTHFEVDLGGDHLRALAGTAMELQFHLELATGATTKRARLALGLKQLGLTSDDPEQVWPPRTCTDEVRACLSALPPGTLDLSPCGQAVEVLQCPAQAGVTFDEAAITAAMDQARLRLLDPQGFAADAPALVGADRVDGFSYDVEQTVEWNLQQIFGQWYPDAAARDAAAAAQIEAAFDLAYARPLDIIGEPHPPAPGDLAATRDVVADALLLHLASLDLEATEFGRSLDELAQVFRVRHVADLRAWRLNPERVELANGHDVYIGRWLDPYVEITVNRASGKVTQVYFEID